MDQSRSQFKNSVVWHTWFYFFEWAIPWRKLEYHKLICFHMNLSDLIQPLYFPPGLLWFPRAITDPSTLSQCPCSVFYLLPHPLVKMWCVCHQPPWLAWLLRFLELPFLPHWYEDSRQVDWALKLLQSLIFSHQCLLGEGFLDLEDKRGSSILQLEEGCIAPPFCGRKKINFCHQVILMDPIRGETES